MGKKEEYVKESKKQICSFTLNNLKAKKDKFDYISDKSLLLESTYIDLVLFSPSKQSNLGNKLSNKIKKHIDELVNDLACGLDIKHVYFFSSFESKNQKVDLSSKIVNDSNPLLALYCPNSFTESLYASVRNALAHGNIIKKGRYYYLYSVSSKEGNNAEEEDKLHRHRSCGRP